METRKEAMERLRDAATKLIRENKHYGEAYYLRKLCRQQYDLPLSNAALRVWMQELADQGHFVRSQYPYAGYGYTWMLPEKQGKQ